MPYLLKSLFASAVLLPALESLNWCRKLQTLFQGNEARLTPAWECESAHFGGDWEKNGSPGRGSLEQGILRKFR